MRKCSVTKEKMTEGWIDEDVYKYFKYQKDVVGYIKRLMTEDNAMGVADWNTNQSDDDICEIGYNHFNIYWTEWIEDPLVEEED